MRKTLFVAVVGVLAAFALALPGLASSHDRNRDQIPDRWERHFDLSLKVDQADRDQDRDGLDNMCEFEHGDNPRDADTDDDGAEDRDEAGELECENENEAGEVHDGDRGPGGGDNSGPGDTSGPGDSSGPSANSGPGSGHSS
jgi:hypothetical protein